MTKQELEVCIETYGKEIYSFCKYLTCDVSEADDLYQDTFLKAVERQEIINNEVNPKSWLLSAAIRIWKNRKRKYAWRKRIADVTPLKNHDGYLSDTEESSPEENILLEEEKRAVRQAVSTLPDRLRIVVLLYYMEELQLTEIAAILKIPAGTVKSRLHQARKLLSETLKQLG